jgi:transposase-like protein
MPARKKRKRAPVRTSSRAPGKATGPSKPGRRTRHRYSDADRRRILDTAKREHLTGAQVRDRFGISTLTFYTWQKQSAKTPPPPNRSHAARPRRSDRVTMADIVRREVRAKIASMLPAILKTEIASALGSTGSRRRR